MNVIFMKLMNHSYVSLLLKSVNYMKHFKTKIKFNIKVSKRFLVIMYNSIVTTIVVGIIWSTAGAGINI